MPTLRSLLLGFAFAGLLGAAPGCAAEAADAEVEASAESSFTSQPGGGNRYDGLEDLEDAALKTALFELVKNHSPLGYNRARKAIFVTGLTPSPKIECVYTGRQIDPDGTTSPDTFNTEHSWPQSLGANSEPAKSDLHHLFPSEGSMNSARGNHPFREVTCLEPDATVTCSQSRGGSALGRADDGSVAFEVRPQKRGDIARAQFYFAVRYKKAITAKVEATLKNWHVEDPVDDEERFRNDKIEEAQNNRNPFVDKPEFVARIADF